MKALILAALLAVTPVTASAQTPTQSSLQEEVDLTAKICLAGALGKISADEVIKGLHLDTDAKRREFILHCKLYLQGVKDGMDAADASRGRPVD